MCIIQREGKLERERDEGRLKERETKRLGERVRERQREAERASDGCEERGGDTVTLGGEWMRRPKGESFAVMMR